MATAKIMGSIALLLIFVFCVTETEAGEYCYNYGSYRYDVTYCTYGCCGSSYDKYCCGVQPQDVTVWMIALGIIGGIIFIACLVALVCCCLKKQSHAGRVVQPAAAARHNPGQVTVVYTAASGHHPGVHFPAGAATPMGPHSYAGAATPMGPPSYKQFDNPPPAYNYNPPGAYSDPAYPPSAPPSVVPGPSSSTTNAAAPPAGFNTTGPFTSGAAPSTTNLPPLPPQ